MMTDEEFLNLLHKADEETRLFMEKVLVKLTETKPSKPKKEKKGAKNERTNHHNK